MKWLFGKKKNTSNTNTVTSGVGNANKSKSKTSKPTSSLKKSKVSSGRPKFRPFSQARAYARGLKLKNETEWRKYSKSGKKPKDIPAKPNQSYKDSGWNGMGDWLGTGNIASNKIVFRSFKDARSYVHKLKLKSDSEWRKYCRSGKKPKDIPAKPDRTYLNKGWKGIADWVGK